jgi:hypothetical protein
MYLSSATFPPKNAVGMKTLHLDCQRVSCHFLVQFHFLHSFLPPSLLSTLQGKARYVGQVLNVRSHKAYRNESGLLLFLLPLLGQPHASGKAIANMIKPQGNEEQCWINLSISGASTRPPVFTIQRGRRGISLINNRSASPSDGPLVHCSRRDI